MIYTIFISVLFASVFVTFFLLKKKNICFNSILITKILAFSLLAIVILKATVADGFTTVINGGEIYGIESNKTDVIESIIRCGLLSSECLIFSLLVTNNKSVKWILSHITLPFIVLALIYFYFSVDYLANPVNFGKYFIGPIFASILMVVEYGTIFAISLGFLTK